MALSQSPQSDVTDATRSGLFKDLSFWLSSTVPQRSYFKNLIEVSENKSNGPCYELTTEDARKMAGKSSL